MAITKEVGSGGPAFDTRRYVGNLKRDGGFNQRQADAQADGLQEALQGVAMKSYIEVLRAEMKSDMSEIRAGMKAFQSEMRAFQNEMKAFLQMMMYVMGLGFTFMGMGFALMGALLVLG